ncbi:phosphotransferase [Nocardia alni]|uniref:phosphotransferase n=1 Tax=Nocardia alni TaxID=2815723 RepID=UPI001C24B572|nr:aminoglycoside phosphotransferase family protein [Nocardia alni]
MDLDADGAELIQYSVNAVFRLVTAPVVVRVAAGALGRTRGRRLVTVASWLEDRDAPTVQLLDGDQPIDIADRFTFTFWDELDARRTWTAADLARPLRALHTLQPDSAMPQWDPFGIARERLAEADSAMSAADLAWLREEWDTAEETYRKWQRAMPFGVIHGDPHLGNLLADGERAILCDLDETGIGPILWDLVPQAVGATRFSREPFYRQFVDAYGADVREESYWPVLQHIRELIMVTSVLPNLSHRPEVAAEHAHRLGSLRRGDTTVTWHRYQ